MIDLITRRGKFYLGEYEILSGDAVAMFAAMEFIPMRVEHLFHMDKFEYIGASKKFRIVAEGECIPEYNVRLNTDGLLEVSEIL